MAVADSLQWDLMPIVIEQPNTCSDIDPANPRNRDAEVERRSCDSFGCVGGRCKQQFIIVPRSGELHADTRVALDDGARRRGQGQ